MPREFHFTRPLIYATLIVALIGTILGGAAVPVDAGSPSQAADGATLRLAMPAPETGHRGSNGQRRMTFSEGVSASMKPWRLKMRSAYFISGAAALGSSMP